MNHRIVYRTTLDAVRQVATAACLMLLSSLPVWGQASQVPNAKQQFISPTGAAYDAGQVFMYVPNTFTKKSTWIGPDQGTQNTNPILLDNAGRAKIWGVGSYRQVLKDKNGLQIWDELTIAPPITSTAAVSGSGDFLPIGTILPIGGYTAPANYLFAFGQAVSRTTYADALTALTIASPVSCTSGGTTLSGITSTAQIRVGAPIEGSCLAPGTTVASIATPTSVVLNIAAIVTSSSAVRVFNWGNGDGSSTFNLPDLRGRVMPGADAMGGTAASRLTSTYYGVSASPPGAASTTNPSGAHTQTVAELAAHTHTGTTDSGGVDHTHTETTPQATTGQFVGPITANNGWSGTPPNNSGATGGASAFLHTHTFTTAAQGSSTPFSIVQPSVTVNYAIKVLNGTLPVVGVLSLGGMTGDILCGAGITCTSQTISFSGSAGITVGVSPIGGGVTTRVLFDNANVLGEYAISGTGSVAMTVSPALTGVPTAPTAAPGTNTTQLATTAFVAAAIVSPPLAASPYLFSDFGSF